MYFLSAVENQQHMWFIDRSVSIVVLHSLETMKYNHEIRFRFSHFRNCTFVRHQWFVNSECADFQENASVQNIHLIQPWKKETIKNHCFNVFVISPHYSNLLYEAELCRKTIIMHGFADLLLKYKP